MFAASWDRISANVFSTITGMLTARVLIGYDRHGASDYTRREQPLAGVASAFDLKAESINSPLRVLDSKSELTRKVHFQLDAHLP